MFYGCSNSTKAELIENLNEELANNDEFIKEGSNIEAKYIQTMRNTETEVDSTAHDLQVELVGEVPVDDGLVIHGESNLPEDAKSVLWNLIN